MRWVFRSTKMAGHTLRYVEVDGEAWRPAYGWEKETWVKIGTVGLWYLDYTGRVYAEIVSSRKESI